MRVDWSTALATLAALLALLVLPAGFGPAAAQEGKLRVVATTSMIADAAREVGGDLVEIRALMGPGVDPHGYRQTRTDIAALVKADLVLWHGLHLEAQLDDFLRKLARTRTVVAVADALPKSDLAAHDEYKDRFDPHVWMDPALWKKIVTRVRDALIEQRPGVRAVFEANAERHIAEIARLAAYAERTLATVPAGSRVLLTAHDAFKYFARAYSFEVVAIQGISTESEAGLSRISELVDLIVKRSIRAVFVETSVSDRNVRALLEGARARGHEATVGGELFSDAMGQGGTYEGTYIGMIDHNVTTITQALGGTAPPHGMSGRLARTN